MASELYDYSDFTGGNASDLMGHMIRWGMKGKKLRTTRFHAMALTDGVEVGSLKTVFGSSQDRIMFKARIIGPNPPKQPPDPCDPSYFNDPDYVFKLISMHTWFVSVNDTSITSPVTRGDVVLVELEAKGPKDNPRLNMKYGRYLKLMAVEDPPPEAEARCAVLIKMFGKISHDPLTVKKMNISATTGMRVSGIQKRTINFENIKFKPDPACVPANRNSDDVIKYFGKDKWEQYKRSLSKHESGSEKGDYKAQNKWWYVGRYQFGIEALSNENVLTKAAYKRMTDKKCGGQGDACIKLSKEVMEDPTSWSAVGSLQEWFDNKGDIQETAFYTFTNKNFQHLKNNSALDLDSPADVAGMLAAIHLRGPAVKALKKTGYEVSDRTGTFPSYYYTKMGGDQC